MESTGAANKETTDRIDKLTSFLVLTLADIRAESSKNFNELHSLLNDNNQLLKENQKFLRQISVRQTVLEQRLDVLVNLSGVEAKQQQKQRELVGNGGPLEEPLSIDNMDAIVREMDRNFDDSAVACASVKHESSLDTLAQSLSSECSQPVCFPTPTAVVVGGNEHSTNCESNGKEPESDRSSKSFVGYSTLRSRSKRPLTGATAASSAHYVNFRKRSMLNGNSIRASTSGDVPAAFEKRFKCAECGYSTNNTGHFRCHVLKHSATRPFSCRLCFRTFTFKSALMRHEKSHNRLGGATTTSTSELKCPICECPFLRNTQLVEHFQTAHPDVASSIFDKIATGPDGAGEVLADISDNSPSG